jgi:murein DD-endopeptidase MepM/ murein hydrolase activator NlpD
MKKVSSILLTILFIICHKIIFSQTLPALTWSITSDYGPRNISRGSWFHKGIDYEAKYGETIYPVEGGMINCERLGLSEGKQ